MTVRARKTKRDEKIKKMLVECYPITQIARFCKISPTRVRQIKDSFLASGELMAVPHTKPVIYIDPRAHALGAEFSDNDRGAERNGLTREPSYVRDSLPPNGRLPLGMINAHIKGRISMTVRKKGQMKDIKGPDGLYVGYWDEPTSGGKGKKHWKAHLRLFRQELSVNYYESSKGTTEFYVNPGRVYYYPNKVKVHEVTDHFIERALYIANILKNSGWEVTDPQLPKKFQLHRGKEGDPLAALIPPRYHDEGQDITSDTSPDYLETEIENATDEELVEIYASMPTAIAKVRQGVSANSEEITVMKGELIGLKEVVEMQGDVIRSMVSNLSELTKGMAHISTLETSAITKRFTQFTGEGYQ